MQVTDPFEKAPYDPADPNPWLALYLDMSLPLSDEVKAALQGNICRCTGYVNIVEAVVAAGRGSA